MPTPPEPWRILTAADALSRLQEARHHLDEALRRGIARSPVSATTALGTLPEVTRDGALWEAEDRLPALAREDAALAARLREVAVLPEIEDVQPSTNGRSH